MKNLNHFLLLMLFLSVVSCKKDNITYDEYEIINLFTQQISPPIPPPPPDFKNWDKLAQEKRTRLMARFLLCQNCLNLRQLGKFQDQVFLPFMLEFNFSFNVLGIGSV